MKKHSVPHLLLLLCVAAFTCVWQIAAAASSTILVMGDSLSAAYGMATQEGWVSLLGRRLERRGYDFRVVNASISGETTSGGFARLPHALDEHRPNLVIIELGANDGLRGIDPDQIQHNLTRMIEVSQRHGARVLLTGVQLPANYGATFRQRYFAVFDVAAKQAGVPLVHFLLEGVAQDPELMQQDGLHPTVEAQPMILGNVWPKLEPLLDDGRAPR